MSSKALISGTKYAINKKYRKVGQSVIRKATQPITDTSLRTVLLKSIVQNKIIDYLEDYYKRTNQKPFKSWKGEEALGKLLMREARINSLGNMTDNEEEEEARASSSNSLEI